MSMRSISFRIFLIAIGCATFLFPVEALAQDDVLPAPTPTSRTGGGGRGSIAGRVVLPSGQPVGGRVRVTLSNLRDPELTIYTDNNGGFAFPSLAEATYTLEVSGDPKLYDPITQEVRLHRGMQVRLMINLKEKTTSGGAKPAGNVVSRAEIDPKIPALAKKEYEKGVTMSNEGKIQQAIERFKQAITIYPQYLLARNDLGVQYLKIRRLSEAAEQFEAAIEINPKAFNPQLNLGITRVEQKQYSAAKDLLRLASSIDSASPAAHLYLGIASVETDEVEEAARELSAALSIGGIEFSVAHFYLAHVHMKKGERDEAVRELEAYLAKSPNGEQAPKARQLLEQLK
jgi:Flp pilus assembly protein TadD